MVQTSLSGHSSQTLRNKRICLLIAHPDDEAMFFSPTVIALTKAELGNHVTILCLSSGDAEGLGEARKKELITSALILGVKAESDVHVLEDKNFPDSMSASWDPRLISDLLITTFAPNVASVPTANLGQAEIDVLITFDDYGVSNHPNHKSLYLGSVTFVKTIIRRHPAGECPTALYTLTSLSVLRKYSSVIDALATACGTSPREQEQGDLPTPLLFANRAGDYQKATHAIVKSHQSRMMWFRWGWVAIGR